MIIKKHLKGNSHQRRIKLRELIRLLKPNQELIEDEPGRLTLISHVQNVNPTGRASSGWAICKP